MIKSQVTTNVLLFPAQYEGLASTLHAIATATSGKPHAPLTPLTLNIKRGRGRPASKNSSPCTTTPPSQSPAHRSPQHGGTSQSVKSAMPSTPQPMILMQKKPLGLRLKKYKG